jgi:hypothetical protein
MPDLDPKAAADAIRPAWAKEAPPVSAEEQHVIAYLTEVCKWLGVEPTPINIAHAQMLLTKADIGKHRADEYPKMLNAKDKFNRTVPLYWRDDHPTRANTPIIFETAEEEEFYNANDGKALSQEELDSHGEVEPSDTDTTKAWKDGEPKPAIASPPAEPYPSHPPGPPASPAPYTR